MSEMSDVGFRCGKLLLFIGAIQMAKAIALCYVLEYELPQEFSEYNWILLAAFLASTLTTLAVTAILLDIIEKATNVEASDATS